MVVLNTVQEVAWRPFLSLLFIVFTYHQTPHTNKDCFHLDKAHTTKVRTRPVISTPQAKGLETPWQISLALMEPT